MGSLGDNGGGWPSDGGLPDVPPEWGDIVIPDDLSALAEESAAIRAELYGTPPRVGRARALWQRLTTSEHLRRAGGAGLPVPVLIITMAVLVTFASLFASAWPRPPRPIAAPPAAVTPVDTHRNLPALTLLAVGGQTVPLRGQLPAVILLIDDCDCDLLVRDTAAAVPADIAVVTVTIGNAPRRTTPASTVGPPAGGAAVAHLWDPTGELRDAFDLGQPDGTAAALLVDHTGWVLRTVPRAVSVEDLRPDLARLS